MKASLLAVAFVLGFGIIPLRAETPVASYGITWVMRDFPRTVVKKIEGDSSLGVQGTQLQADSPQLEIDAKGNETLSLFSDGKAHGNSLFLADDTTEGVVRYAITGEVSCDMSEGFSYLVVEAGFVNEGSGDVDRAAESEGLHRRLDGRQDWRPFELTWAGDTVSVPPFTGIDFKIQWAGAGKVSLRNLKLVQYRKTLPLTPIEQKQATKWGLIGGIGGGLLGVAGGTAAVAITVARRRRQKREEELRRMAALDVPNE